MKIRAAAAGDASMCAAIYAPYVADTAISFESVAPSPREMATRIATANERHAWLVAEHAGQIVGYAYAGGYQPRAAYRWACEVSVYVATDHQRAGAGRALYETLLGRLAARGYLMAVACMTLPNEASAALHAALGFEEAGIHRRVGYKHGAWHDITWLQRPIGERADAPADPH